MMEPATSILTTTADTHPRKPRYRRSEAVSFQLQRRDLEIIRLVHKHRFLSSEHIIALLPGSRKGILRRLHFLFHGKYLDRPLEQIKPFVLGSRPLIYAVGPLGADLLNEELGIFCGKVDWAGKNREVKRIYLEHTLMVAHFMVCLEIACRKHGGIRIIETEEIVRDRPILRVKGNFKFKGQVKYISYSLEPDKVFGLHFLDEPEGSNRAFFLLEADRSTMPVRRINPYKSSFEKKIRGYWECWQKGAFKEVFGFQNARVLTLAKSNERIQTMSSVCRELGEKGKGSRMFLFTVESNFMLADVDQVLAPVWQSATDDRLMSLVE